MQELSDYERGRREGRREVVTFLRQYAASLATKEARGGFFAGVIRNIGADATEGLAKLIEEHYKM